MTDFIFQKDVQLNRYENIILSSSVGSREFRSILSGISRSCRLSRHHKEEHLQTIWETGANIIGPLFYFFVWWALESAQKLNIKKLYFLSRDGYIFLKIAQIINNKHHYPIDCRYLYGSRQLWLVSSLERIGRYELDWIMSDWWFDLSVESVCKRITIKPQDISQFLKEYGFEENLWKTILAGQFKENLRRCLLDLRVQKRIVGLLQPQFENTLGYLKQEGLDEKEKFGIVDIGWKAKPQASLHKTLKRGNILFTDGIHGFYFGTVETKEVCEGDQIFSFMFDLTQSLRRYQLRNNHLYEAFASSDEGKIQTFGLKDSLFVPVLEDSFSRPAIDWGVRIQQESILTFAKKFFDHYSLDKLDLNAIYQVLESMVSQFITNPSLSEANVYGSFPMDGEITESSVEPIAPVVTRKKFWALYLNWKKFNLFWVQASLIRSKLACESVIWRFCLPALEICFYSMMLLIGKFFKKA